MVDHRRKLAIALTSAAVALIALSIVSAADAGYYIYQGRGLVMPERHHGYVYLHVFSYPPGLAILVALGMLIAACNFSAMRRGVRIGARVIAGVAALAVAFVCAAGTLMELNLGESHGSTVATSGAYEVVRYQRQGFISSDDVVLRLRSREGLLSYEDDADIACFIDESSGAGPEWLFDHVSLTATDTIDVVAKDGTTWNVTFDRHTLHATNPVDRCTEAPDALAD